MIRVLVADDQALVRAGFRVLIESASDVEVVGEARNGTEAVEQTIALRPDVVLMDIRMPFVDGIEATRRIVAQPDLAATHVLILTTFESDEYIFEGLRAGASGFAVKDMEPVELLHAIRVVASGQALLAPSVTRRVIARFAGHGGKPGRTAADLADLTEREREVLKLVGEGKTNDEIATELFISATTVKTHLSRVMSKLEVHDRSQLVICAYETGLIVPGG